MNKNFFFVLTFFLCLPSFLFAQEYKYILDNTEYVLEGIPGLKTKEYAIKDLLNIPEGKKFTSKEELDEYVSFLELILKNKNLFVKNEVKYEILEKKILGLQAVKFTVNTKDAWNILPIVLPRWGNGYFKLSSKLMYNNFVGTFMNFTLDSNIDFDVTDENKKTTLTPNWNVGVSLGGIKILDRYINFSFEQAFNTSKSEDKDGNITLKYTYYNSRFAVSAFIGSLWGIGYSTELAAGFSYGFNKEIDTKNTYNPYSGFYINFTNTFNWANITVTPSRFRDGIYTYLTQFTSYNFSSNDSHVNLSWGFNAHKSFIDWMELSFRYAGFKNFGYESYGLDYLRSIKPDRLHGEDGHFFNTTFAFSFWKWKDVLNMQMGIFYDFGITRPITQPNWYTLEDFFHGVGLEGRAYFNALKSFTFYASLGIDLQKPPNKGNWFRIWGRPYQLQIKFSLHY